MIIPNLVSKPSCAPLTVGGSPVQGSVNSSFVSKDIRPSFVAQLCSLDFGAGGHPLDPRGSQRFNGNNGVGKVGVASQISSLPKAPPTLPRYMRGFYLKAAQLVSTRDDFLWLSLRFSGSELDADGNQI